MAKRALPGDPGFVPFVYEYAIPIPIVAAKADLMPGLPNFVADEMRSVGEKKRDYYFNQRAKMTKLKVDALVDELKKTMTAAKTDPSLSIRVESLSNNLRVAEKNDYYAWKNVVLNVTHGFMFDDDEALLRAPGPKLSLEELRRAKEEARNRPIAPKKQKNIKIEIDEAHQTIRNAKPIELKEYRSSHNSSTGKKVKMEIKTEVDELMEGAKKWIRSVLMGRQSAVVSNRPGHNETTYQSRR